MMTEDEVVATMLVSMAGQIGVLRAKNRALRREVEHLRKVAEKARRKALRRKADAGFWGPNERTRYVEQLDFALRVCAADQRWHPEWRYEGTHELARAGFLRGRADALCQGVPR